MRTAFRRRRTLTSAIPMLADSSDEDCLARPGRYYSDVGALITSAGRERIPKKQCAPTAGELGVELSRESN